MEEGFVEELTLVGVVLGSAVLGCMWVLQSCYMSLNLFRWAAGGVSVETPHFWQSEISQPVGLVLFFALLMFSENLLWACQYSS